MPKLVHPINRRDFVNLGLAAAAGAVAGPTARALEQQPTATPATEVDPLLTHRFGVDYTPTRNWYYCWNDFDPDAIARDFDAIAAIGADHIRVMLIWPYFQPNPRTVSEAHFARFDRLMRLAGERKFCVCAAMLNGWLSGYGFNPPFVERNKFYDSEATWQAAELYIRSAGEVVPAHDNFLGFDLGNEMNCFYSTNDLPKGDAWLERALALCETIAPQAPAHAEGVDHLPWFMPTTFSATKLATRQKIVPLHCWNQFTGALKRGKALDIPSVRLGAAMSVLARSYAGDAHKPTWVQEYGASTTWMEAKDIPAYLERTTLAGVEAGVSWHTWWASHDIDRKFLFGELEYGLGLLTVENKPKEQAHAFKAVADAHRGQPVKLLAAGDLPPPPGKPTMDSTWEWLLAWMNQGA